MPTPRHRHVGPWGCLGALLALGLAARVAWAEPAEVGAPDFARPGPYIGVGASFGFPIDWNDAVGSFESAMSEEANANAEANAEGVVPRVMEIEPVVFSTLGMDFEQTRFGAGGLIGYRLSRYLAIELEGAWLSDSSKSFKIEDTDATGTATSEDLWMVTGNARIYPATGRFQPFAIVGFGVSHARLKAVSRDLTTTAELTDQTIIDLPAPSSATTDRLQRVRPAGRFGLGLDGYVTEHVALEVKADYAIPFVDSDLGASDLVSLWAGLLYRF